MNTTNEGCSFNGTASNGKSFNVYEILIQNVNNAAAVRTFDMFIPNTGSLVSFASTGEDSEFNTVAGSVPAESDAGGSPVSVVSVGATDAQTDALGNSSATVIESYSSQGATESTPQAASRMKPDVTATDDVSVTGAGGFGFNGSNAAATGGCVIGETPCFFPGTSAAAPHAAAIAALALQAAPCLLSSSSINKPATARANLRNFLTSTAVPLPGISQAVPNNIEGFGLLDALAAIRATLPTAKAGQNQIVNGTSANGAGVTLNGTGSDPDSCPVTLSWAGSCGTASGASATLMCPIGNDTETLTVSNGGVSISLPTSTVQIAVSDFSLKIPQGSATVHQGQSASYTVTVGSKFGAFTNPVSLACSGLPSLASCSFSPGPVTPGSGSATSTVTISTTAPSSVFRLFPHPGPNLPQYCGWLAMLTVLSLIAAFARKRGKKLAFDVTGVVVLVCLMFQIAGCGGGGSSTPSKPGTPTGTYTVTVAGTSKLLQHSTTATLTVQ